MKLLRIIKINKKNNKNLGFDLIQSYSLHYNKGKKTVNKILVGTFKGYIKMFSFVTGKLLPQYEFKAHVEDIDFVKVVKET